MALRETQENLDGLLCSHPNFEAPKILNPFSQPETPGESRTMIPKAATNLPIAMENVQEEHEETSSISTSSETFSPPISCPECPGSEDDDYSVSQKRRRQSRENADEMILMTTTVATGCAGILAAQGLKKRKEGQYQLFSSPLSFKMISNFYGDDLFRKNFQMSRPTFQLLLHTVGDLLERKHVSGCEFRRETIPADIRLAVTLRIIAGASYCHISLAYQVKESTIFEVFASTCDALMERLRLEGLPKTKPGLQRIAEGFQKSRRESSPIFGCVGALNGICIKIKKPKAFENPATFYSRKGFYALPVQALCHSNYIFRYCSVICTGATHDALAYAVSGLKRDIDAGILSIYFFIVGDEAYICTEELITPFGGDGVDVDQSNFNYFLSSLRIHIEQAFGILVARWRILRGGLEYSLSRSTDIICLLMKLHNFCLTYDGRDSISEVLTAEEKEQLDDDVKEWYLQSDEIAGEFRSRPSTTRTNAGARRTKRDALVEIIKEKNRRRPNQVPLTATACNLD